MLWVLGVSDAIYGATFRNNLLTFALEKFIDKDHAVPNPYFGINMTPLSSITWIPVLRPCLLLRKYYGFISSPSIACNRILI